MGKSITLTFHGLYKKNQNASQLQGSPAARYEVKDDLFRYTVEKVANHRTCVAGEILTKKSDKWFVLSFDDGLISDYEIAFPILKEFGVKATFFITAQNVGKPGYLSWGQIKEMAAVGMEIGSHGLTHNYLPLMPDSEVQLELLDSKKILEQGIGMRVVSFAPVGGHFGNNVLKAAGTAGYSSFATMVPGITTKSFRKNNLFMICRNHLQNHHNRQTIDNLLNFSQSNFWLNRGKYEILNIPKKLFGLDKYDQVKNKLFSFLHV